MWSNSLVTTVQPIGPGTITVRASGTDADGPPVMGLGVDGARVGRVNVDPGPRHYKFACRCAPGRRRITATFGNDRRTDQTDRNLTVHEVVWEPAAPLSWAPPALDRPNVLHISHGLGEYRLQDGKDYRPVMPPEPFGQPGGLMVIGGRNVALIGGEIHVPAVPDTATEADRRGLLLARQTGAVHVEGLHLTGPGLGEGIDLDQPAAESVTIQNVRVEQLRTGPAAAGVHSDAVQTWSGPRRLRIDRLTATTSYQGLMLGSAQHGPATASGDLRNISLIGTYPGDIIPAQYLINDDDPIPNLAIRDVWCHATGGAQLHAYTPADSPRAVEVQHGIPPVDPCPAGAVGVGYHTPGYATA